MGSLKNRRLETVQSLGVDPILIPFSFQLNGVSTPVSAQGLACTVARSDTGLFTVTLPAAFPSASFVFAGIEVTGAKGGNTSVTAIPVHIEASGSAISGTFQVRTMTQGTTTLIDVAASATARVNCLIFAAGIGTRSKNV